MNHESTGRDENQSLASAWLRLGSGKPAEARMPRVIVDLSEAELEAACALIPFFKAAVVMQAGLPQTDPISLAPPATDDVRVDTACAVESLGVPRCTLVRWIEDDETLGRKEVGRWRVSLARVRGSDVFKRYKAARR